MQPVLKTIRAASMHRMGRRRLPPAKTLWRMARWIEWGNVSGEGRSRSSAASVRPAPEASRDCSGESICLMINDARRSAWDGPDRESGTISSMDVETAAKSDRAGSARRRRDLVELWVGYALILVVIWTPRPWQRTFYFVAATFVVAATWLSFPGWKAMGFGVVNLARSMWLVGVALLAAAAAAAVAGRMHTLHSPGGFTAFLDRYAGYMVFALVQQALLQSYFLLHFLRLTRRPSSPQTAALAAAAIFSLAHLPNPILTVCTFVWGLAACLFFLRYRNLYSLSIAHAILGITLAICVPGPVIRNMRVGLGYLTYHAPRADHGLDHRNH
jgi:hypothetical protein